MSRKRQYLPITDLLEAIVDNRGKSVPTVESGFPLIATNCIKHSSIYPTFENIRYVSDEVLRSWFRAHLKPNDILFVNKGTPGRVCLVPNPITFCAAQDMIAFRCDPAKIYYKYLLAVLRSSEIQKKISNFHVGLVIPHFRKQDLDSLLIPVIDYSDQINIGDLYFSLSEKIELNNRINAELEAMAKTLYDYWFVQFDFPFDFAQGKPDAKGKPYKSSGGKMVWNEELKREIPEGWEVKNLYEVESEIITGKTPSTKNDNYFNGDVPFICIGDVRGNMHIVKTEITLTQEGAATQLNKFIPKGAICVTCIASPGLVGFATKDSQTNQQLNSIVCKQPENRYYLYFYLTDYFKYSSAKTGNTFANMNKGDFSSIRVIKPDTKLLLAYQDLIETSIEKVLNNSLENQQLASLRDWLLPMLMNGQVTVGGAYAQTEDATEHLMAAEPTVTYGRKGK